MRSVIEAVTCSRGVFLGLVTSDGRGPLLDCTACQECDVRSRLLQYQRAARQRLKMFDAMVAHEKYVELRSKQEKA